MFSSMLIRSPAEMIQFARQMSPMQEHEKKIFDGLFEKLSEHI